MPPGNVKAVEREQRNDVIEVIVPVSTWRYKVVGFVFAVFFLGLIGVVF